MEPLLQVFVTEIESRLGNRECSNSSLRQRLHVLLQLAEQQGCLDKQLASRIRRHCRKKAPTNDMRLCLPLLRASLARWPASKTFELRLEDFPELPTRKIPEQQDAMPPLELPRPHNEACATPQESMLGRRDLWFRDSTGMVHFGAAPPSDVPIVQTGRIMNGTLVM